MDSLPRDAKRTFQTGVNDTTTGGLSPLARAGLVELADDYVRMEITLPWLLLAKLAEKFSPPRRFP